MPVLGEFDFLVTNAWVFKGVWNRPDLAAHFHILRVRHLFLHIRTSAVRRQRESFPWWRGQRWSSKRQFIRHWTTRRGG